jgi:uncharacterized protein (TIGR02588 family)
MARSPTRKSAKGRTPLAEWLAAAIGLVLTLGVIGNSLLEGLASGDDRPDLTVEAQAPELTGKRHLVPIVVRNAAHATAAGVEVRGVLMAGEAVVEERHAVLTYVPGKGQARGALIFEHDPKAYMLSVTPEGYEEP